MAELGGEYEIKHIMVKNESACYEERKYIPDSIITDQNSGKTMTFNEENYYLNYECEDNGFLWLYRAAPNASRSQSNH